ncbi:MAG: formimidoylglutamase [Tatlockia sp.]
MTKVRNYYHPTNPTLWQGRKDSLPGESFFHHVRCTDLHSEALKTAQNEHVMVGFCSDEGIRRNEGRVGAKEGPLKLRELLAKTTCHNQKQFIDIGNIVCEADDLEGAQAQFAELIHLSHQKGYKTLAFGGGHEIAWGHFCGLASHYPKLGIINFDAHFDLRAPDSEHNGTSGTPFYQIAAYCAKQNRPFDYCCLGIQPYANSDHLFLKAKELQVHTLFAEQIRQESFLWQKAFLDHFLQQQEHLYLSICLDVLAESFAPGVSAPQAMGLTPWQMAPLLKYILQTGKVVSIDIAELSPPLDEGVKTARLAANLLAELLNYF